MNEQLQELLCDYLEGEVSADKRKQIEELLASDPELRRTLAELQQARGAMRELPVEAAPQYVREAIRQQIDHPQALPMFSAGRLTRVAAMLLLALGGGLVIWSVLPVSAPRRMAMESRIAPSGSVAAVAQRKETADAMKSGEADYYANARAVMVVRASDVPAAEREIGNFLASNNIAYVNVGRAGEDSTMASGGALKSLQFEAAAAPAVTPAPVATASPVAKAEPAAKVAPERAREAGGTPPGMPGMGGPPSPAAPALKAEAKQRSDVPPPMAKGDMAASKAAPFAAQEALAPLAEKPSEAQTTADKARQPQQLTMRNMNQEQVRFIRENVYNMADGRKMQVDRESPEIAQTAATQAQFQNQLRRQMPYVQQRDMDQVRQDARMSQQSQSKSSALYDLTIVVEPADQLPRATAAATLPSSRPR